ncbi:hypothetical protein LTS18_000585, partial [Coniosporium uncinatum]
MGKPLLGSAGREYDYQFAGLNPSERLAEQKKTLIKRLGLSGEYMDEPLVTDKDINAPFYPTPTPSLKRLDTTVSRNGNMASGFPSTASPMSQDQTPADDGMSGMSKRQLNALKRKHKKEIKHQANKVQVIDLAMRRASTNEFVETPASAQPHAVKVELKQEGSEDTTNDYFSLDRQHGDDDS